MRRAWGRGERGVYYRNPCLLALEYRAASVFLPLAPIFLFAPVAGESDLNTNKRISNRKLWKGKMLKRNKQERAQGNFKRARVELGWRAS
jgi:hypothetical protein